MKPVVEHDGLLERLRRGDQHAFELLYDEYSGKLYSFIHKRVGDKVASEEIIQDVFIALWNNRKTTLITSTIDAYLFGAAKLRMFHHFRQEGVRQKYSDDFALFEAARFDNSIEAALNIADLEATIEKSLVRLPEKTRTIFRMSRQQHLPNQTIAEKLNLTLKTVENNLSMALKHLRADLGEFMMMAIMLHWMTTL